MGQNNRLQSYVLISEGVIFNRATFTFCSGGSPHISNTHVGRPELAMVGQLGGNREERGRDPAPTSYPAAPIVVLASTSLLSSATTVHIPVPVTDLIGEKYRAKGEAG
jgi:hypothetical protein